MMPAASVEVAPSAPVAADDEVVEHTVVPFRAIGRPDATAHTEAARPTRPVPPPGRRRGRRFGGH